ncbi:unnamed protein product [Arabis nemorensis]|uniref:Brf1 TBP-binding domain-containing protein n=1 Tax=Arabis nemorensis TaxID=586526 RepID=A0A565CA08_9BRAS|nr:unnamed protein product [Arabis nemorensis]
MEMTDMLMIVKNQATLMMLVTLNWIGFFLNEDEKVAMKTAWEALYPEYVGDQAVAGEASNASNANSPEYAVMLFQDSKAAVAKSRKEKRRIRAEEAKNVPPPATAMEAVRRTLDKKRLSRDYMVKSE